jgi:FG-GAP repeat
LGSLAVSPTGEVSFLDTTNGNASLGSAAIETAIPGRTFTTGSTPGVGSDPVSVAAGDFNGDGIPDLATLNSNDSTMTVLLGKGGWELHHHVLIQCGQLSTIYRCG